MYPVKKCIKNINTTLKFSYLELNFLGGGRGLLKQPALNLLVLPLLIPICN